MAKYRVKYSCGHGEHTVEVFGSSRERRGKLDWYEKNFTCPSCWKESKRSEPIKAEIIDNMFMDGVWLVLTQGDTYSIKETLKEKGFRWITYYRNTDVFGQDPRKAWGIRIPEDPSEIEKICEFLRSIGVTDVEIQTNPMTKKLKGVLK